MPSEAADRSRSASDHSHGTSLRRQLMVPSDYANESGYDLERSSIIHFGWSNAHSDGDS